MLSLPLWVYFVIAGIIFSAFMLIKTAKEERDIDMEFIEKEGEIYIKRMEAERERRKKAKAAANKTN
ncbi:sporulation YhaL family protein [Calidifontibacillus erzurumensis]|uniref:SigE-dependent sporulation protein n=1 Tax=Calidifontibacillus erzurumensis TaxID=2741433 RepID=A0A8J8GDR5_9BACI|nr:sporulation YhaL family protein [Calidifontibacillus erzurumensis]NSL51994.1 SigE-dependent sporulation protein [Calidifontibacillus erzurumensis]